MDIERASEHDLIATASAHPQSPKAEARHRVASAMWVENYASEMGRISALEFRFRSALRRADRIVRLVQLQRRKRFGIR